MKVDEQTFRVTPQALDAAAWQPFGWIPRDDTDPGDGSNTLTFTWNDPHVNVIGHTLEEVTVTADGLRCDELFRHDTHTQTIMPLDHRAVIAVAPADRRLDGPADRSALRAFVLDPLQAIVLHRGTWHWGPYPVDAPGVRLFNVQGLRYAEDNTRVDLAERGLAFEVVLPSPPEAL